MTYCDLCGARSDRSFIVEIEGVNMKVCDSCSKLDKNAREHRVKKPKPVGKTKETVYVTVLNFGSLVRGIRVKMGMSSKEFASELFEKESMIKNLEAEEIEPSLKLSDKFYSKFGVKLVEVYEQSAPPAEQRDGKTLTFGDVVGVKER
ncbi:MAG: TIGR00270 family protein [Candidatus Aenigmarchaeota archaeon]|nr:TIGR00270 family protein [Candidatus Aenigmarchaeota archaeon]